MKEWGKHLAFCQSWTASQALVECAWVLPLECMKEWGKHLAFCQSQTVSQALVECACMLPLKCLNGWVLRPSVFLNMLEWHKPKLGVFNDSRVIRNCPWFNIFLLWVICNGCHQPIFSISKDFLTRVIWDANKSWSKLARLRDVQLFPMLHSLLGSN
jgi:hypothetical protein